MKEPLAILEIDGTELAPWLDALGELRIRVFREYPYLYDGSLRYEREYLGIYQRCGRSRIVLVTTPDGSLIGATTCMPLADETTEFQAPFLKAGIDVNRCLYFGESIVLPEWRGFGLGREFFARREAHARRLGLGTTTFCAVDRPENHPLRPAGYRPLDGFWKALGYAKQAGLQAVFPWKEIGEENESPKTLTFWTKSWTT
jgi:GNAT superfamily N-acetyltransferase